MKARYFKKIRNSLKKYKVVTKQFLTDDWTNRATEVLARHPGEAVVRFLRQYRRKHKERHIYDRTDGYFREESVLFAHFQVTDERGYKTYWL